MKITQVASFLYPFIPGSRSFFHIDSPPETIAVTGDHSVKWIESATS